MKQIEINLTTHNTDDMLPTEQIKKLKKISSGSNGFIENVLDSGVDTEDTGTITVTNGNDEEETSPQVSPSTSTSEVPVRHISSGSGGPLYERNLLKKRIVVPDISFDYNSDDVRTDDDTTRRISNSDKKYLQDDDSESELKHNTNRKQSMTGTKSKARSDSEPSAATLAVKKISRGLKSPMFLRKNNSFKQTDSAVSSSAENNEQVEKRKKRKISIGKRKKSQQSSLAEKADTKPVNEKSTKPERSTKFRRRKPLTKSQSEYCLGSGETLYDGTKSKLVLLYSGNAVLKSSETSRKNRLETLKNSESFESNSSEYEGYSSAFSDVENNSKPPRPRRGLAKRFWKSINTLFVSDDQSDSNLMSVSTPPSLRRRFNKSKKLYRSMPGGLQKLSSKRYTKSTERINNNNYMNGIVKDEIPQTLLLDMSAKKNKKSQENILHIEGEKRRTKSLDYVLDKSFTRKLSTIDWFQQRKKAYSTATPKDACLPITKDDLTYKIVLSQAPTKVTENDAQENIDCKDNEDSSIKNKATMSTSMTFDNGPSTMKIKSKSPKWNRRKEYVKLCLNDLKCTLQREINTFLEDKLFQPNKVNDWCRLLSESIKGRVVQVTEENFKVVVQVFIGSLCDDGIHAAVQSTTGAKNSQDGFFTVTYKGKDLFAVASILTFEL